MAVAVAHIHITDLPNTLSSSLKVLSGANRFLVGTHVSPDPDAIGSSFGLGLGLVALGKSVTFVSEETVPTRLIFNDLSLPQLLPADIDPEAFDVFIGVDAATAGRLGRSVVPYLSRFVATLNIDHHISNDMWAETNIISPDASSSCEMVFHILNALGSEWRTHAYTPAITNYLYAGIMDDTGSFRFSNTSPHALRVAADLVSLGATPAAAAQQLYFSVPERVARLRAQTVDQITYLAGGAAAYVVVSLEMLERLNCTSDDTDGLVDLVRSIEGVQLAVLCRETAKEGSEGGPRFKLSLRSSTPRVDVNAFAGKFGGGGHTAAAGCTLEATRSECEALLNRELPLLVAAL